MVRIKIKINSLKGKPPLEVSSLLNTGFGTEEPEVLVPVKVAEKLTFWPELPEGATVKAYETAGGIARMCHISKAIEIQAATGDKMSKPVKCSLVISEIENEVLLSDRTIEELDIVIESPAKGLWKFKDDVGLRNSVEPQYW